MWGSAEFWTNVRGARAHTQQIQWRAHNLGACNNWNGIGVWECMLLWRISRLHTQVHKLSVFIDTTVLRGLVIQNKSHHHTLIQKLWSDHLSPQGPLGLVYFFTLHCPQVCSPPLCSVPLLVLYTHFALSAMSSFSHLLSLACFVHCDTQFLTVQQLNHDWFVPHCSLPYIAAVGWHVFAEFLGPSRLPSTVRLPEPLRSSRSLCLAALPREGRPSQSPWAGDMWDSAQRTSLHCVIQVKIILMSVFFHSWTSYTM